MLNLGLILFNRSVGLKFICLLMKMLLFNRRSWIRTWHAPWWCTSSDTFWWGPSFSPTICPGHSGSRGATKQATFFPATRSGYSGSRREPSSLPTTFSRQSGSRRNHTNKPSSPPTICPGLGCYMGVSILHPYAKYIHCRYRWLSRNNSGKSHLFH